MLIQYKSSQYWNFEIISFVLKFHDLNQHSLSISMCWLRNEADLAISVITL